MHFPFSFVFSVPGMVNPFAPVSSSQATGPSRTLAVEATTMNGTANWPLDVRPLPPDLPRRRPTTPTMSQPQPLSRKRGWVPSTSEPSQPTTVPASTRGYLDTPSKYRDLSSTLSEDIVDIDDMVADLPPPKRRRTLAGSIVSTALSAALIGTAVGLTVYRLWRGQDKHPDSPPPPPPYEQGEWVPPSTPDDSEFSDIHFVNHSSGSKQRKQRHVAGRRTVPRHKKMASRTQPRDNISFVSSPSIPPEFNFSSPASPEPAGEIVDQMDWMSTQLAKLIEEGKRALNKEVVVMSETKEDEEDDGSGLWEDDGSRPIAASSSGSVRRNKRPRHSISSPPPSYTSPPTTPRKNRPEQGYSRQAPYVSRSPKKPELGLSTESTHSRVNSTYHEDDPNCQSPELRESMERARQLYLQRNRAS